MDINMTERKELVARFQRECKGAEHRGPDMIAMTITPTIRVKGADLAEDEIEVTMTATETDRHGDIVRSSGAGLKNYRKNPVVLFGHRSDLPAVAKVVKGSIVKGKGTVTAKVKFAETPLGLELLYLYKNKFMNAWSIGFIPLKWEAIPGDEDSDGSLWGPVDIKKWELLELSAVTVGACPSALTNAMRSGTTEEVVKSVADWAHEMREKGITSEEDGEMDSELQSLISCKNAWTPKAEAAVALYLDTGEKSDDLPPMVLTCTHEEVGMALAGSIEWHKENDDDDEPEADASEGDAPEDDSAPEPDEGGTPEETPDATPAPSGDGAAEEGDEADGPAEPVEDSEGDTGAEDDEAEATAEESAPDDTATDAADEGEPADGDTVNESDADADEGEADGSDAEDDAEEALRQGLQDTFGLSDEATDTLMDVIEDQVAARVAKVKAEIELDTTAAQAKLAELRAEMEATVKAVERLAELRDEMGLKDSCSHTDKGCDCNASDDDDEITDDETKEFAAKLKSDIAETIRRKIDEELGRVID